MYYIIYSETCAKTCLLFRWFCGEADRNRAEELLNTVQQDGAFLLRFSSTDKNVFVLSLRYTLFLPLIYSSFLNAFALSN